MTGGVRGCCEKGVPVEDIGLSYLDVISESDSSLSRCDFQLENEVYNLSILDLELLTREFEKVARL